MAAETSVAGGSPGPWRETAGGDIFYTYEEFTRLAETRLGQNTFNYLNIYQLTIVNVFGASLGLRIEDFGIGFSISGDWELAV